MPSLVVDLVTIGVFFVGFAFGYQYCAWKNRRDGLDDLKRLGIEQKVAEWMREKEGTRPR